MNNFNNINKCKVSVKEAWMDYIPDFSNLATATDNRMELSIDSGSTFTRFCQFNSDELVVNEMHQINSDVLNVTNINHINSASKSLFSNLEFIIKDMTLPEKKPTKFFDTAHFVKGDLLVGMPGSIIERSSRVSKTTSVSTVYNALAAITLEILERIKTTREQSTCYHVSLALTMPPKDFKSKRTLETFKNLLAGHYNVFLPRLKFRVNILIETDIHFENEPTAIVYSIADRESEDTERSILDKTAIIIDGGGGTTDKAVVIQGQLADAQADTGEFGGKMLLNNIAKIYVSETGRTKPELTSIENALNNGILIRGNSSVDIFDYISSAKETSAQEIFNDLNRICDDMRKSLDDIEELILHGGLFKDTVTADGKSCSVAQFLAKKVHSVAPDIKISLLAQDNYVCEGAITSLWVNS